MKILIIGGAGFIGSNLVEQLIKKNQKVFVIDDLSKKGANQLKKKLKFDRNYKFNNIDIKNFDKLYNYLKKNKFSHIYLLAGQVAVTTSLLNPRLDFNSNALGCFNVLEAIRKSKSKPKLIFSSTNKVYGKLESQKTILNIKSGYYFKKFKKGIDENYPVDFITPYGCSKGIGDFYCQDYYKNFNINTVVLRQSCIYGRMQLGIEDQGWIAWFIIASLLNKQIKIYGDGNQVRDALYADDLIDAYIKIANSNKTNGEVYNIGGGYKNKISLNNLISLLQKKLNKKIKVKYYKERKGDQKVFISNNNKAKKDFNWYPTTSFDNGLSQTIEWIEHNLDFIRKINRL